MSICMISKRYGNHVSRFFSTFSNQDSSNTLLTFQMFHSWRPGMGYVNQESSLTTNLQIMILSFLMFSLLFASILLFALKREAFRVGLLDPKNPQEQKYLLTSRIFVGCCGRKKSEEDMRLTQRQKDTTIQSCYF